MIELQPHDLQWVLRILPRRVLELMKSEGPKVLVAGGFIRSSVVGERANDIDIFCPSQALAKQWAEKLSGDRKVMETGNAYSVRKVSGHFVQFIHRWTYESPEVLLKSFDFTIACAAIWWDGDWKSLADDRFYADLAAKRLVYLKPERNEDAGGSMLRVLKFYQRGFRIPLDSLGAVITRLVDAVDLQDVEVLEEFEGSSTLRNCKTTEQRWAKIITGLLREVDPAIDPSHIAHLPSLSEEDPE